MYGPRLGIPRRNSCLPLGPFTWVLIPCGELVRQVVHNICRLVLNTSKAHAPEILDIVYSRFRLATPQKVPESRMLAHREST